jgi:hypothetical protein
MTQGRLPFNVTGLDVTVPEGVKIKWQGREMDSGPLTITLGEPGSSGVIDYDAGNVNVEFRVRIAFPELSEILTDLGAEPGLAAPVDAVIRSTGVVFEDHSFRLAGKGEIAEHMLFDREQTKIDVLAPTKCRPDAVSRSGPEICSALLGGEPVSWNFNPTEKRVVLVLPEALGGESHLLCLAGSYTFTAVPGAATAVASPQEKETA